MISSYSSDACHLMKASLLRHFPKQNIPDYDTDEHCWKSGNINILFAVDAMYTRFDADSSHQIAREKAIDEISKDQSLNISEEVNHQAQDTAHLVMKAEEYKQ